MHTLNCYLLGRNGRHWTAVGTPGGDRQVQWDVQVISNLLDHGMDVQQAVEAPRWVSWLGTDPALIDTPMQFHYEDRFDPNVIAEMERRGHRVDSMTEWGGGGALQVIARDESGVLSGGVRSAIEGCVALGW